MANLFWKQSKRTFNLLSKPFASEDEFERIIYETKVLFEDLTFLKRQAHSGSGTGRPDILAIDNDGNVCIIEMKNVTVDEKIFSQIVGYAIWAKSNPDSLKNLWYELDDKPEIDIDWDNYEIRILVIAPEINPNTMRFLSTIQFQVDLIEIKRWVHKKDSFLLVNYLEKKEDKKVRTVRGTEVYDKNFYDKYHNKKSVIEYLAFIKEIEKLLKSKRIDGLEKKYNKHYCGFKYGFFNVFSIAWIGTKSFGFRVRMKESELKKFKIGGIEMSYFRGQGIFKITPQKTKAVKFLPLIRYALKMKTHD
jgi:hypothetical protein